MLLTVKQLLTQIEFEITGTGGAAWTVQVGDTLDPTNIFWARSGAGDTKFAEGLFGVGTHYAFLTVSGVVQHTTSWVEQAVVYREPPPTPTPTPTPTPPTPTPTPTPTPSGGIGYCSIETYQSAFGTLFRYGRGSGEVLGDGYTRSSDAEYRASINTTCFIAPAPVIKPSDLPGIISSTVATGTATTTANITAMKNELLQQGATTQATGILSFHMLGNIQNALFPGLKKSADEIWERVQHTTQQLIEIRNTVIGKIDAVATWQAAFKFPDWKTAIVQPVSEYIDAKVSKMFGIDPKLSFWDELAAKIDIRISQKFGVDPALPFFDALYAKIERKIDVWFSGKLGIDPKLPFAEELRKKIVSFFVKSFDEVMEAIIPEPPKVK